ncbi:MAG: hypothetical protein R2725_04680 [Solirubrobacterales bacterium]
MSLPFDSYVRRAHLVPAALAAAPAIVLCLSLVPSLESVGAILAFLFSAVLVVVCTVVRSLGRRLEPGLWASWGGAPTTRLLRWHGGIGAVEQSRRHQLLECIIGDSLPTADEEEADPEGADSRYAVATTVLRQRTRTGAAFDLVAQQNADYGMRRNCLGLRPVAIAVAGIVLVLSVIIFFAEEEAWRFWVPAAASSFALPVWWFLVNGKWVRSAADLYATRLMETIETLANASNEETAGGARTP